MLGTPWDQRKSKYDLVVIGSGYGGAITAARLASANLNPKPSVCILERGKEWQPGEFPETLDGVIGAARSDVNPLGLYELLTHPDISVIKGSGLGGTSLINANVAIVPDREVFEQFHWPSALTFDELQPYYARAARVLAPSQHPRALQLAKVKALDRRAQELGISAQALNIAVNFTIDGVNPHGVEQQPCNDCGNCVSGCNVKAKNTLYMNYLPMARNAGATILTQTKVEWLEKLPGGGWRIHGKHVNGLRTTTRSSRSTRARSCSRPDRSTPPRSCCVRRRTDSRCRRRWARSSAATAISSASPTTAITRRTCWAICTRRAPAAGDSPAPGPNIVGLVRYTNGVARGAAHRGGRLLLPERVRRWRQGGLRPACAARIP